MDDQLAEIRRMHAQRAAQQRAASSAPGEAPAAPAKTGKVIGGKYFANPPKQIGMQDYEAIVNKYQRIQRQKKAMVPKIKIDSDTASFFQSFLRQREFKLQRYAIMYGKVDEDQNVYCHCCYEPEQEGGADTFKPLPDKRLPKVDAVAEMLGFKRVGVLVSSPPATPDAHILSATEALLCAEQQALHGPHCCLVQMRLGEDMTSVKVEAYQVSAQMVDIWKEKTLSPHPTDPKLVHSERELEAVQEETRDTAGHKAMVTKSATKDVDTIWFTVPVPIEGFVGEIENRFIRVNRPGEQPPTWENVKIFLKDPKRAGKSFVEQVADFQLIVFLTDVLDVRTDLPVFTAAIVARDSQAMANYETLIKSGCGLI